MWCMLDGNNSRTLAKAVQALSKIGSELFIEADEKGLLIRTVNSIESATARIRFNRCCFLTYHIQPGEESYCLVTMKTWLNVFRNMRHVEQCEFRILKEECKLSIRLKCRSEMMKIALLSMIDDQNINAEEPVEDATNVIAGNCKVFNDMLRTFTNNGDEVTLIPTAEMLIAQNYVENARVNHHFMRSKIQLSPWEFETYKVEPDASITFAIREIRAFVLFAEALKEKMTVRFSKPGYPCFVEIKKLSNIESMLIISTLCGDDVSFSHSYAERSLSYSYQKPPKTRSTQPSQKRKNSNQTNRRASSEVKRRIVDDTTVSNTSDSSLFQFNEDEAPSTSKNAGVSNANSVQAPRLLLEENTEVRTDDIAVNNAAILTVSTPQTESGPQVTFYNTPADENDNDCLPESPERANFVRTIFSRCFESTYMPREPSPNSQIYAPNSDTED